MILAIIRTGFMNLRRDRGALILSFIVPIAFFSIFAGIFGSRKGGTDPIQVAVVDEDRTAVSRQFVEALQAEGGLRVQTGPETPKGSVYDAATAEAAVRAGDLPVAVIVPAGFGENPIGFEADSTVARL
ncbi:MAG TPA: ABC transporter permease, partial [Candidatus Saccharimonadales bacterium]|nr:ABC transporter permease [Candidatus Saccharimonadales bacterium]